MSVVRIDEATLDYVYHYDILQDIEGNLITEDEVTRVFDCSKGIITYQKPGYVVVMKNLITGEKIYESDYYSLVLASKDASATAKVLTKFAKRNEELVIKGGVVDGKVISAADVVTVSKLPNKEGLISMFLGCLQASVRNFACAIKAVADSKAE